MLFRSRRRPCPTQAGWPHRRARRETLRHTVCRDGATRRGLIPAKNGGREGSGIGDELNWPFKSDIREVADAGGVGVIAVAKYGDVDHVRRRRILPDFRIDAGKVDPRITPRIGE